jgi:hypothetical protein
MTGAISRTLSPARLSATGVAFALLLSGCATLSESQCVASDWQTVGYSDGVAGIQSSRLLKHQNACVKHGVIPDREAYLVGWEKGVRRYCVPENGFNAGESGKSYTNVCPVELQESFHAAYQEGRQIYLAKSEIDGMNRQIAHKEQRLRQIEQDLAAAEAHLIDDASTPRERRELLSRTRALAEEQGTLEAEIQDMKVDVILKTDRLNHLRQSLAYSY